MKKILIIVMLLTTLKAGFLEVVDSVIENSGSSFKTYIIEKEKNGNRYTCIVIVHNEYKEMKTHCFKEQINLLNKNK